MKLNDKGFSLVQVLISSGLLGAAAVVGIKIMNNQQKIAESTNQKFEIAYIHEEIWRSLQNPLTCEKTFNGKSIEDWNQEGINSIKIPFKDGKYDNFMEIYKTYDSGYEFYGMKNLKINKYFLKEESKSSIVNLRITFNRGNNTIGAKFVTRTVPISYTLKEKVITSCTALPLKELDSDKDNKQSSNKAFKKNLKLSINTSLGKNKLPTSTFDIYGNLSITTKENLPCTKEVEGSMRFNKTSNAYEFCTGNSDWKVWGRNRIDWQRSTELVVNVGENQRIGRHRYCSLTGISNAKIKDCKLNEKVFDLNTKTDWYISKSNSNNGSCTFTCFD